MVALLANVLLVPAAAASSTAVSTLPTGMTVASGQASATQAGSQLTITNAANTILNWQSFSIGSGATVRFVQPSSTSQVLNRVTGNDPSSILGSLDSNGRVWLLNPNGVLFGQGARVDVGSLVVSTLDIADTDWLAGNLHFAAGPTAAAIDNRGTLTGSQGGRIVLVGSSVTNEGTIAAPGGQVVLAAGDSVDLVDTGAPNLSVHVQATAGQVLNLGTVSADGGRVDIYAAAVNQQGIVRADALGDGPGGTVVLAASGQLTLAAGSHTSADAANGTGGTVQLTGNLLSLEDGSAVSANGATGGGVVLAGGGAQGQDANVPNAQALYFARGARISADALDSGNGGHIVLWSDDATRAFGSLSARGGSSGGNGGLIETSGGWLDANPLSIDVSAAHGIAGEWLLDPYNVTISDNVSDANFNSSFTATGDATISSATLTAALDAGTNVTVQTGAPGNTGTSAGNITVLGANIIVSAAAPGSLTLIADHDISLESSTIQTTGGAMPVSLYSGRAGLGGISVDDSSILTAGGTILLGGFTTFVDARGVTHTNGAAYDPQDDNISAGVSITNGSVLNAGGGDIFVYGVNSGTTGFSFSAYGLYIDSATLSGHDITLIGAETSTDTGTSGATISNSTIQATHALDLQGVAAGDGVDGENVTFIVQPAATDTTASLAVTGLSSGANGILFDGVSFTTTLGATMALTGTGGASGAYGVELTAEDSSPVIDASGGGGAVTFTALGTGLGMDLSNQDVLASTAGISLVASGLPLSMENTSITSAGPLRLTAPTLSVTSSGITSTATGDAIVASDGTSGITSLSLQSDPFSAPDGRWIVWLSDLAAGSGSPALPAYDFLRFGVAGAADWSGDTGNGLVYSQAENVTVTGNVATKTYDGTVAAQTSQLAATPADASLLQASVNSTAYAQFSDKNAGTGKSVGLYDSANPSPVTVTDTQGRPVYGTTVVSDLSGTIVPATLTGTLDITKVYDATTGYSVAVTGLVGLVGDETVGVTASGSFASKNVGANLPVSVAYQVADGANGGLAGNYVYSGPSTSVGTITPLALYLAGLTAADKVYDATTTATGSGTPTVTALSGDSVNVAGTAQLNFADKNVGTDKAVSVSGLSLAGTDAGNYTLVTNGLLTASITPAVLTYVASPLTLVDGATIPALSGNVTGFVGGETLASSTSGSLAFTSLLQGGTSSTTVLVAPGHYAITGSGLSAGNYVFVQAAGNGQALTVVGPLVENPTTQGAVVATQSVVASQRPQAEPGNGVVIDATGLYPFSGDGSIFGAQPLDDMSSQAVAALVDARNDYKQALLAGSLDQLSVQPGLADLPPCQSLAEAATGTCLVTDVLRREARASAAAQASAAPAPSDTTPAPVAPATPAPPAPAAVAAAKPAGNAAAAAVAAPPKAPLFSFRPVRTATLPQIEHKVAVLIGVDDYQDASIPHLTHAVGDAQAMTELFAKKLGYETLTLSSPTRATVVATLNRLALEMGPRDSVLVYYAGHGAVAEADGPGKNEGYWLLADSTATRPEGWLSNADIARLLGVIDAGQVALISDSCYSGTLATGARVRVAPEQADPGRILSRRTEVVMSSGGNEPVFDAGKYGHSPFAWNLLETLGKTSGWTPGDRVFERVRFAVARELPQHPQYAGTSNNQADTDYLFEQRQLEGTN